MTETLPAVSRETTVRAPLERTFRVVLDLIRDQPVAKALDILQFCERDAATLVGKLLRSALANAEHVHGFWKSLYVTVLTRKASTTVICSTARSATIRG